MLSNSKVLITGGAGFIGSNLVESFLKNGNKVICLDNLSTGKFENISEYLTNSNFTFIEGDIRNFEECRKACLGVAYVFHHAALGSVSRSIEDPLTVAEVNITGFLNMLLAAKETGVKKVIYASSSSVYGDDETLPKVEPIIGKPLSPYAVTKRTNEMYAENFSRLYGMEIIGLRYFNVFGKKQNPSGAYAAVIPKFITSLMIGEAPIVYGDGSVSRDFTYVDNVVRANYLAAVTKFPDYNNEQLTTTSQLTSLFNIACGATTSINELFRMIRSEVSKFKPEIARIYPVYKDSRKGEILHSNADISKAKNLLKYFPAISLKEGLSLLINSQIRK
ncbi:MAG TPA: LPS biosynthesis protein WbpP [Lentisphaeria bacterium]|nr:MAG: Vi polysaccharide biosynthesis protein VipB/TviC [Lentisphaerae bacterium GWF2_38_69]HBM16491.1 LPS biosynthesis protein WbpP [Lentisphaeria bacterium]